MGKRKNYSGSDLSSSWKTWVKKEINRVKKELIRKGCTELEFSFGFYDFSGFFTSPSGQMYYIFSGDTRGLGETDGYEQLVFRTVTSYKDYTGGHNQRIDTDNLENIKLS